MSYKKITHVERENVYAEGKLAFDEHKRRDYNPYAASNLTLTVSWRHGWDTAEEEESKSEKSPLHERPA
jgi:hypothetical protein